MKISNIFTFLFNRDSVSHRVSLFAAFSIGCVECVAYSWARKKKQNYASLLLLSFGGNIHTLRNQRESPRVKRHTHTAEECGWGFPSLCVQWERETKGARGEHSQAKRPATNWARRLFSRFYFGGLWIWTILIFFLFHWHTLLYYKRIKRGTKREENLFSSFFDSCFASLFSSSWRCLPSWWCCRCWRWWVEFRWEPHKTIEELRSREKREREISKSNRDRQRKLFSSVKVQQLWHVKLKVYVVLLLMSLFFRFIVVWLLIFTY